MEKITRHDGVYYYGDERCSDVDDAYSRFRSAVHAAAGRRAFLRLDRLGQRRERTHGYGFVFNPPLPDNAVYAGRGRTPCRIMGFLGIGYVRGIGVWDYGDVPDSEFDGWLDWVFTRGRGALMTLGTRDGAVRNSGRLRARYR